MPSASGPSTSWVEALSPWPEEFGLRRMHALLERLGHPERAYPAIHVVGTNGKSSTARLAGALLRSEGLGVGVYTSPHVRSWSERIVIGDAEADFERAVAAVRPAAAEVGATQFEVLTGAALAAFRDAGVDAAVVEAGLGGRLDATNVLDAPVVVLTNVALEHTEVLGDTREAIAAEKLAVVQPGATVIIGEPEWREPAREAGAGNVVLTSRTNVALAVAAAEEFVGRRVEASEVRDLRLPGRLEQRAERPFELWDGAHNLAGVGWLLGRLPSRRYVVVASILGDKDAAGMLAALSAVGDRLVATASSNPRALPADEVARLGRPYFGEVESVAEPGAAAARARELAGPEGAVLVTGSLYLLADLSPSD
jgi:dihydrofolate synthase/folylpolyglutamate synthase